MKEECLNLLRNYKNNKIISLPDCFFTFVEGKEYSPIHPLSDYYFKLNDLSINSLVSLKWSILGYFFYASLSENILKTSTTFPINNILPKSCNYSSSYGSHTLYIDSNEIKSVEHFLELLNTVYSCDIFDENDLVRFKLIVNLSDFILLQNLFFPTLFISN